MENYLYVKVDGFYINDDINPALNKIFSECKNCGYSKILIDALDVNLDIINDINRFFIGVEIAKINRELQLMKIAYVVRKQYINRFAETVARNRGAHLKAFYNRDEATQWISL
jgi:hypothetical protein